MNRLRLAISVLVNGDAVLAPAAPRPDHQTAGPPPPERPAPARSDPVADRAGPLIALRDSVQAAAADLDGPSARPLNAVARQLTQILAAEHVVPIEDSGAFDPGRHNAVDKMETTDQALDYQIVSSVRSGYLSDGTLLRRQDVIVYRFTGQRGQGAR